MPLLKNTASQKVAVYAYDGNGLPVDGDAAQITAQISLDYGASAAVTDTNPTELDAINHPGWYVFDLTQAETNADAIILTPTSSTDGVSFSPIIIYPTVFTGTRAGYIDNLSGGAVALASALATIASYVDDLEGRLTAARAGYLDELAAANIPADVDTLLSRLSGSRAEYLDNLSAGAVALASEMAAYFSALNDITVAQILDGVVEGSLTVKQTLRVVLSVLAGKSSGGGTTSIAFRDQADSKDRVSATVTAAGNRTAVTVDGDD